MLETAQIVANDLSALNIPVNVIVTTPSQYAPPSWPAPVHTQRKSTSPRPSSNIMWFGTATFAPDEPTPADSWLTWVSNETSANNWAIYSNPIVQTCVNDITNGTPASHLLQRAPLRRPRSQHDAPYIWLGSVKLRRGFGIRFPGPSRRRPVTFGDVAELAHRCERTWSGPISPGREGQTTSAGSVRHPPL